MQLKEKLSNFFNKLTPPLFVSGLVLATTIVCLLVLIFQEVTVPEKAKVTATELRDDFIPSDLTIPVGAKLAPRLKFASYDLQTSLPTFPQDLPIYQLENNLSTEKRTQIAQKLNLTNIKPISDSTEVAFVNQEDINSLGYLFIDQDGSFEFKSFGVHKGVVVEGADATKIAQAFLRELGVWEENFLITTTYQKEGMPEVTFVEIHRVAPELPILNPLGLVAIPPEISLDSLQAGTVASRLPADPSIINSSDGKNGIARPNDFNTITIMVADDGRIVQATSNLRLSEASSSISDLELKLKTPQQALEELKNKQAIFGITLPIGQGIPNLEEIYPNNEAQAEIATITDFILAYLEKSPNNRQNFLQPVYVFRGTTTLTTGPTVQWSQIVPAVEGATPLGVLDKLSAQSFRKNLVPLVQAQNFGNESPSIYLPGLGYAVLCVWDPSIHRKHTYCFKPTTSSGEEASIQEIRNAFLERVAEQYTINVARALLKDSILLTEVTQTNSPEEFYPIFNKLNYVPSQPPASGECYQRKNEKGEQVYTHPGDVAPLHRNQWWADQFETLYHNICIPSYVTIEPTIPDQVSLPEDVDNVPFQVAQTLWQILGPTAMPTPIPTIIPSLTPTLTPSPTTTLIPTPTPTPTPEIFEPLGAETHLTNLQAWADQSNLFPKGTLRHFFITLYYATHEGGRGQRYISGESPTIFVYNANQSDIKIELPFAKVSYIEPLLGNRLYYEYDSSQVKFSELEEGFIVEKKKSINFIRGLAAEMELNEKETQVLLADTRRVINKISPVAPYIKISLVNQEEINQQLPLSILPQPNFIMRIHLLLTPLQEKISSTHPLLPLVNRSDGFYLVEVGARLVE